MFKILRFALCLCLFVAQQAMAQTVILDFETPATSTDFQYFGSSIDGSYTTVIANPNPTGLNMSANVLQFSKPAGSQPWAGASTNPNPTTSVNLVEGGLIHIKFHTDHPGNLTLKFEQGGSGPLWIQSVPVTTTNEWVDVVFDPSINSFENPNLPATGFTYEKVVLFADFGTVLTEASTYYIDDIIVTPVAPALPGDITFSVDLSNNPTTFTSVNVSGTFNTWSGNAWPLTDADGDMVFEGTYTVPAGNHEYKFTMDDWAMQEEFMPGGACTVTNGAFTNRSLTVNGDATLPTVCWMSCVACGVVVLSQIDLPVTFDEALIDYTVTDFGDNSSVLQADPTDPTNMVVKTTKSITSPSWSGTTVSTPLGFANAIPVSATDSKMSVRVYSPLANSPILLKIEDSGDATKSVQTIVNTTVANAWETLVFDFNNEQPNTAPANYTYNFDKASVFFNFDIDGATSGELMYLWDDVKMYEAVVNPPVEGCTTILDFETAATSTTFSYFASSLDGTFTSTIENPNPTGLNTSATVLEFTKPANSETYAGAASSPVPTTPLTLVAGSKIKIKFHTAAVGNLTLKLEQPSAGGNDWIQKVENDVLNEWVEIVFDPSLPTFEGGSNVAVGYTYGKVVLFTDFGSVLTTPLTYYIDDIKVCQDSAVVVVEDPEITFKVDMSQYTATYTTVNVSGTFNSWSGDAWPLTDADGDLVFEGTYEVAAGNHEYKFTIDNWAQQEAFVSGTSCTVTNADGFVNRSLTVVGDAALNVVCWNSCAACVPPVVAGCTTILDFETAATSTTFLYFGSSLDGTLTSTIANPNPTGLNTSATVLEFTKPANSETYAGAATSPVPTTPLTLAPGSKIKVKFHTEAAGNLTLKLEQPSAGGNDWIQKIENDVVNEWVEIVFDPSVPSFEGVSSAAVGYTYGKVVLFTDFGTVLATPLTYYIDDIEVCNDSTVVLEDVSVTFKVDMNQVTDAYTNVYVSGTFNDFSGTAWQLLDSDNDNVFEGTYEVPAGNHQYKFTADDWNIQEELMASMPCVVNPDGFNNRGLVALSDLVLPVVCWMSCNACAPPAPEGCVDILDFETPATTTTFEYFGSTINGTTSITVANPNPTGLNTSATVLEFNKPADSQVWAGAYSNPIPTTPLSLGTGATIKVKFHTSVPGNLTFKLEDSSNGGPNWVTTVNNDVVNEWVELEFDPTISSFEAPMQPAAGFTYTKIVLFTDFGTVLTAPLTYYIDDIKVCGDSITIGTQEVALVNNWVKVYPTQTENQLNVVIDEVSALGTSYEVFDAVGRQVQVGEIKEIASQIQVGTLPAGAYYIHVRNAEKSGVARFFRQ